MRIHEVAKELEISSKDLLTKLNEMGLNIKNHMSSLDDVTLKMIKQIYAAKTVSTEGKNEKKEEILLEKKKVKKVITPHIKVEKEAQEINILEEKSEEEKIIVKEKIEVSKPSLIIEEKVKNVVEADEKKTTEDIALVEDNKELLVEETPLVVQKTIIKVSSDGIVVSELANKMKVPANELIKKMISLGIFAAMNQRLDLDTAMLVASDYNCEIEHVPLYGEDILQEEKEEDLSKLKPRPPVVTIMGHVDHGKTKLLDAIRSTNIMDKEAGGITQHIGAYLVETPKGKIVFLDTPGHAAFTAMRARGAQVTDIVILVVAADDGVMPQTIEAIDHARSAQVPIIVAVNKIDKPEANVERVKRQLSEHNLLPEEWGGNVIYVEISAKQKIGLDHLLEMILLQAEMMELKANPEKMAQGIIIEAKLDKGRGSVATVLVHEGTLHVGDAFVTGPFYGKVRAMYNDFGKKVKEVGPCTPVEILGFSGIPQSGDIFQVAKDERIARQISMKRQDIQREKSLGLNKQHITLEELYKKIQEGDIKELNLIIKADVQGSTEAIAGALSQLETAKIKIKVIHASTGSITETDVMLASASNAVILGFNVKAEGKTSEIAIRENVEIKTYNIIYEIINEVRAAMEGMLEPILNEIFTGKLEVREMFNISKFGKIAGSYVLEGEIFRNAKVKILRQSKIIFEGKLESLKRFKDDVKSVSANFECGIKVEGFNEFEVGDIVEAYKIEKILQKL